MTHSRRVVLVLSLATMISVGSQNQGQLFPELRTYFENQVENVTCPRSCSHDGDSVTFCIFDNATSVPRHLTTYLSDNGLLVGDPGNDCGGRTSGNGTAFISFTVKPRMSGCTIYCVQTLLHCSSLVNTLIQPLLINVEAENRCNNASPTSTSPTSTPPATPTTSPTSAPPATPPRSPTSTPPATPTTSPTSTPPATPTTSPTSTPPTTPTTSPTSTPPATPTTSPTSTPPATPTKSPTSTPPATPTKLPTSTPPATPTTSAENLSSLLSTPLFSSTPNLMAAITDKSLIGGIAVGVFIAGLLLGVTCGIAITIIVTRIITRKGDKPAATASSQELHEHDIPSRSSLGDSERLSQH